MVSSPVSMSGEEMEDQTSQYLGASFFPLQFSLQKLQRFLHI